MKYISVLIVVLFLTGCNPEPRVSTSSYQETIQGNKDSVNYVTKSSTVQLIRTH